ncbi:hypothetical protein SNE40_002596 [Patella caerulea]|uniref:Uncharacterized protein n=1 Tax=Patella caerulea TaxID=87958 RepID=A0AAN8KG51_PATCE
MNVILTLVLGTCAVLCLHSGADATSNYAHKNQDFRNEGSFVNDGQLFRNQGQWIRNQGQFVPNQGQYIPNQDNSWPGQSLWNRDLLGQDRQWRGQENNFERRPNSISSGQRRYKRSAYRSTRRNNRWANEGNNGGQWLNQEQTTSELWRNRGSQRRNRDRVIGNRGQQWRDRGQQWRNRDNGLLRNQGQFRRNSKNQLSRGHGQILDIPTGISAQHRRYKRSLYRSTRRNNRLGNQGNNGGQWFNRGQTTQDLLAQRDVLRNRGQRFENQGQRFDNQGHLWENRRQTRRLRNQGLFTGNNDRRLVNQGLFDGNQGQQSINPPRHTRK